MDHLPETIPGLVGRAAERFGDLEALVDEDARLTFAELAAEVERAGRALAASGITKGDRVAIWAPNCREWVIAALGIFAAGGVLVPINTRFKGAEGRYGLERADAHLLFTVTDFLDTNYAALLQAEPAVPSIREVIDLRGAAFTDFLGRGDTRNGVLPTVTGDDLYGILFTSGTTGRPKGAMLTHGAAVRAYDAWSTVIGLREGDRYLVVNPFFHSFGLNAGIIASLIKGATVIPHPVFDVDAVMRRAAEEKVSMLPGPPTVYQ
jgi:acyl-CoA synthetase (AMP-forming)/AMP-acid ligase II